MALKEDIIGRLEKLIGNRSLRKVSSDWDIPQPTLHNMFKNKTDPKIDNLEKISERENVSVEWLLAGTETEQDFVLIPEVNIDVSAGSGTCVITESNDTGIKVTRQWLHEEGLSGEKLIMVRAKGDSMEPIIPNGSSMIVNTDISDYKHIMDGIYVLRIDDLLMVKRLRYDGINKKLSIISENPIYSPIDVDVERLNDITILGRVTRLVTNL